MITLDCFDPHSGFFSFPLDIHYFRLLPGFHNFTDMAWTANILLISCGISFLLCINILGWLHCLQRLHITKMEGVCFIFDATYSCLVWLWEIEQKKYPYYIAVGYGVGQAPRLLCEWVLFMYDSFFKFFYYAGSVCQMFRAQVRWLLGCPCHSQAGECIPVILNKHNNITLLNVRIHYL